MNYYKGMSYEQLSREAERLVKESWFKNFQKLTFIYEEMQLKLNKAA